MRAASKIAAFVLFATVAFGQARIVVRTPAARANSAKLIEIRVVGSKRFDQRKLAAASGLSLGAQVDEAAMKQAADKLAATGMFTEVSFRYTQAGDGTRVEYNVTDIPELLPIFFDNFVWLPRDALIDELRDREPLFTGKVPNEGEMAQHIAADLELLLKQRNVSASVSVMPMSPQQGGSIVGFLYTVEGVNLTIERVDLDGVSPDMKPVLEKVIAASLLHKQYSESALKASVRLDLLPQYRMRGYLKTALDDSGGKLIDSSTGAVAVKISASEGIQYTLSAIHWQGNTAISTEELGNALTVKIGNPADAVQFEEDLAKAHRIFSAKGYLEARLQPEAQFNDNAQTVSYTVQVGEGPQYHMRDLSLEGVSGAAADQLRAAWTLKPGAVFDASYSNRYFQQLARTFDLRYIEVHIHDIPHRDRKTVDVVIQVRPRP